MPQATGSGDSDATDVARLPSGVYLYRIEAEGFAQTRRMLVVK